MTPAISLPDGGWGRVDIRGVNKISRNLANSPPVAVIQKLATPIKKWPLRWRVHLKCGCVAQVPPPNIVKKLQHFVVTSRCYDLTPTQTQVPVPGYCDLIDLTSAISGRVPASQVDSWGHRHIARSQQLVVTGYVIVFMYRRIISQSSDELQYYIWLL